MSFAFTRKAIAVSIAIALIVPAFTQAASPVKANASCTKKGSSKISAGKKFTCVQKGKKLVWNKGVAITVAAPAKTPSQSPTPTPSPVFTPTPSATQTPLPTPSPTRTQSFKERWNETGSSALVGLEKAFPAKSAAYPEIEIIWRLSETVDKKITTEIARQYSQNAKYWSAYTKFDGVLQVIVGTLDDIEFVCKWRNSYLNMNDQNCVKNFRTDKTRSWDAHTTQINGRATDFYFMTSPSVLTYSDFIARVPHEFFHNVQHSQANSYKSIFPCWAEEAGAEYFGILIGSNGDPEKFLKLRFTSVSAPMGKVRNINPDKEFWIDWLRSTDMTSRIPNSSEWGCAPVQMEGIYHYGLLATEYLHLELGISGILTLYRDAGTLGWDKAIEKAFGKSKKEVYEAIATYMDREYRITISQGWARPQCRTQCEGELT